MQFDVIKMSKRLKIMLASRGEVGKPSQYEVIADDQVVFSTGVEAAAVVAYEELYAERDKPFEARRARERAAVDAQAVRAATVARTFEHSRAKGGRGGRGGV